MELNIIVHLGSSNKKILYMQKLFQSINVHVQPVLRTSPEIFFSHSLFTHTNPLRGVQTNRGPGKGQELARCGNTLGRFYTVHILFSTTYAL